MSSTNYNLLQIILVIGAFFQSSAFTQTSPFVTRCNSLGGRNQIAKGKSFEHDEEVVLLATTSTPYPVADPRREKSARRRKLMASVMSGIFYISSIDESSAEPISQQEQNNDDPLASFGASLNQMDFGIENKNSAFDINIIQDSTNNNIQSTKDNTNNLNTQPNLNDMIEEKKNRKRRSTDPRTHS